MQVTIKRGRGRPKEIDWSDKNHPIVQTVTMMVKQRKTLNNIGSKIGVTREWARRIIEKIKEAQGEEVLVNKESLLTISEVIDFLGLDQARPTRERIKKMCERRKIVCQKRCGKRREWLIPENQMETLHQHPWLFPKAPCRFCKKVFVLTRGQRKKTAVCWKKQCRRKLADERKANNRAYAIKHYYKYKI